MAGKPLKRYGQHYLTDKNIIKKISDAFDAPEEGLVLEIGPGKGELTDILYPRYKRYNAVEIDPRNTGVLREKFPGLAVYETDFLEFELESLRLAENEKIYVIGNIPYYITSQLIKKLLNCRHLIGSAVLMLQYEAVKRLFSPSVTKDYGALNLLLKYYSNSQKLFNVSRNVFHPKPNVTSSVVKISFNKNPTEELDYDLFSNFLKAAFASRRKTLKNSLSNSIFKDYFINERFSSKRAEELDLSDFVTIAKSIQDHYGTAE